LGPNSRSITKFNCRAAVRLPDDVQECLRSQEVTGEVWIVLRQIIIDTAVNEWRKDLHASIIVFVCILPEKAIPEMTYIVSPCWVGR